jgi:hypothetical protein
VVAPLEMKEETTLWARAQSAIQRAAVLYKPRLATFNFFFTLEEINIETLPAYYIELQATSGLLICERFYAPLFAYVILAEYIFIDILILQRLFLISNLSTKTVT